MPEDPRSNARRDARSPAHPSDRKSSPPRAAEDENARAFVAARHRERSWIVDLPRGEAMLVGSSGAGALIEIADAGASPERRGRILWDGRAVLLEDDGRAPEIFVGGK